MPVMYDRQGNPVTVAEAEALQRYQSGEFAFAPDQELTVINPNTGAAENYGADQADALASSGFVLESPEQAEARRLQREHGGIGAQLRAAGEGALSEVTLGGYDLLGAELGGEEFRARRRAEQDANPLADVGGRLGGAVGSAFIAKTGTAGKLLGRAAQIATAPARGATALARGAGGLIKSQGTLGTAGRLAVEGAIEGAAFESGHAISEAALAPGGDYDHLAERIAASAKTGFAYGAGIGGGLGLMAGLGKRAIQSGLNKLHGPEGLDKLLREGAENTALRSMDPSAGDLQKMGEARWRKMTRDVLDSKMDDGQSVFQSGATAEQNAERVVRALDETGEKLGALRGRLDEAIEATGRSDLAPDLGGFAAKLKALKETTLHMPTSAQKGMDKALREVAPLFDSAPTFASANKFRVALDARIFPKSKAGIAIAPKNQEQLMQVRALLEETLATSTERAAKEIVPDAVGELDRLKSLYSSLSDAKAIAKRHIGKDMARSPLGITEKLTSMGGVVASLATDSALPVLGGMAVSAGKKLYRDRGQSMLAVLMDRASRSDKLIDVKIKRFLRAGGDVRRVAVGQSADYAAPTPTTGKLLKQRSSENRLDAYRRKIETIANFNEREIEKRIGDMADAAPSTAASVASHMVRANEYLKARAPTDLQDSEALQPHLEQPTPSDIEIARFARRLQIVDDPLSALDELERGTLTMEHIDALKNVYPKMYAQMQDKVAQELASSKNKLPYEKRSALGTLFSIDALKSQKPANRKQIQDIYQAQHQAEVEQRAPQNAGPVTPSKIVDQFRSEVQSLESGDFTI